MAFALNNAFNSLAERYHRGRAIIIKARGGIGQMAHVAANFFFRLAKIPIQFCTDCAVWQRWEVRCYRMLNGRFVVYPIGDQKVAQEKLPGTPLWEHLTKGTLRRKMIRAAAREFRRAHSMPSDRFDDGLWSHGDATMANVIYDPATDRARLIDFEIQHRRDWPAVKRHADDLAVILFDLVSLAPRRRWLPLSLEFLRTYGDLEVIAQLQKRLRAPAGLYRIWWHVRTNFVDTGKVMRRLVRLRTALEQGALNARRKPHRSGGRKSVVRARSTRGISARGYDMRSETSVSDKRSATSLVG
jgi:hypothetical protein